MKASDGPGMMRAEADENHPEWRTTTYQPGDVLLFSSLTVHGAMPNKTKQLRLSADFRYQAVSCADGGRRAREPGSRTITRTCRTSRP